MGRLMTVVFGLLALTLAASSQQPRVVVPKVVLEDQFEQVHDLKQHRGHVVVVIYGDRASADANKQLGERLHVHYHPTAKGMDAVKARQAPVSPVPGTQAGSPSPDVRALPVACIGQVPKWVQALVRGQFKNGSPTVPVLLDFYDTMKNQFAFKASVPNAVVIDSQGRYRYAAAGTPTAEGWSQLVGVIDQLRKEAVEGK